MTAEQPIREVAVLRAFDAAGREVAREELDLHAYWDDLHPLVDSDEHRVSLRVVKLVGDLYGEDGLIQHFENRYGPSGEYLGGRTEHEDGTVTEE